jgi:ABC-type glutathione transport system ATPase component
VHTQREQLEFLPVSRHRLRVVLLQLQKFVVHTAILENLTANAEMTPDALAKLIVQEYGRYYEGKSRGSVSQVTQSATNLMVVEKLAEALGKLADVLRRSLSEEDCSFRAVDDVSLEFKTGSLVALVRLVQENQLCCG